MTNLSETNSAPGSPGGNVFPTTQWSMVLHAGAGADTQARSALESLCRQYWYPLYSFIRRQGHAHHEAEDCTQEFLARLLSTEGIARARPERGRFRTFLLTALRNFLTDEWRRTQAAKRGSQAPLPLGFDTAEQRYAREPADPALSPEQVFDRNWAIGMINRAVATLREDYEKGGRGALFAALAPVVWDNSGGESHAELARRLGLTPDACNVAIHRLRRRLGERLRLDVAQTVAEESEVDTELRHLISALQGTAPLNFQNVDHDQAQA
jgi:RNA polymerase sigma factor (sigma-70 family)